MAIPNTQRAILQPDKMSTSVSMITDHPVPNPDFAADEHLVRVHATAITNGELLWSRYFPLPEGSIKVLVPCNDIAGTVVAAPQSSPYRPGTEVYARSSYARTGCARDFWATKWPSDLGAYHGQRAPRSRCRRRLLGRLF